jgi:hypothetical protein
LGGPRQRTGPAEGAAAGDGGHDVARRAHAHLRQALDLPPPRHVTPLTASQPGGPRKAVERRPCPLTLPPPPALEAAGMVLAQALSTRAQRHMCVDLVHHDLQGGARQRATYGEQPALTAVCTCAGRHWAVRTWTFFLESSRGTNLRFSADRRS